MRATTSRFWKITTVVLLFWITILVVQQHQTSAETNVTLEIELPITIGGKHDLNADCDSSKYNCSKQLPNEITQPEIAEAIKTYGPNIAAYAHGHLKWVVIGPTERTNY